MIMKFSVAKNHAGGVLVMNVCVVVGGIHEQPVGLNVANSFRTY